MKKVLKYIIGPSPIFWKWQLIVCMSMMVFTSCLKEDNAIVLPEPGSAKMMVIQQQSNYERQAYFDFSTQDTLGSEVASWDLAFDANVAGRTCYGNSGKLALIANTVITHYDMVKDTAGLIFKIDSADWNASYAVVNITDTGLSNVFVIDRGYKHSGAARFYKFQIIGISTAGYEIKYGMLSANTFSVATISKSNVYSYRYINFDNGATVINLEPEAGKWDLLFSRYMDVVSLNGLSQPYLVTGVLINNKTTTACVDSNVMFENIDYAYARTLSYSTKKNAVGYDWKFFNFSTQKYDIRKNYTYLIKDANGVYWKMRFLDFYNNQGKKGYPKFEYQRL